MGKYKNNTTSYVLKDIPVDIWKAVKVNLVDSDIPSANSLLLFLLDEYISNKTRDYGDK